MDQAQIIAEATAALGIDGAVPLTSGGQKWVLRGTLASRDVVVKIVPIPTGPAAAEALERAVREVDLLASVESEFVVSVLSDIVQIGGTPDAVAWVEEYLDGADLGASLSQPWTDKSVAQLLLDIGSGLSACHTREVVHRDLSPGNVRCVSGGRFVLMDPGFARHLDKTALTGLYQPGTMGFRSPEHVPGGEPSPASDVFGLGILAFLARTGRLPVDTSGSEDEYFQRLAEEQAPSILSVDGTVDVQLASIIDQCLQRQAARRYLDGAELLDALDEIGYTR